MTYALDQQATDRGDLAAVTPRGLSQWSLAWSRLQRDPSFWAGGGLLAAMVVLALAAPWIRPYDPIEMRLGEALQPPNPTHWMGTDNYGRDILSRVLSGASQSLGVGVVATVVAAATGTALGLVSAYLGGWVDSAVSWLVDVLMAFPGILLALAIVAVLGTGLFNVLLAVGIASVPGFARLVRGVSLAIKEMPYIEASRALGAPTRWILLRHLLPNVLPPILVWASLGLAGIILSASGLSFLGLGAQPPSPEWGVMVSAGRGFIRQAWWMTAFPGLALVVTVLAINLLGDAARDAIDPKLATR